PFKLTPRPAEIKLQQGSLQLNANSYLLVDTQQVKSYQFLNQYLQKQFGFSLKINPKKSRNQSNSAVSGIQLELAVTESNEAYDLVVGTSTITIRGSAEGIFRGITTLIQLIHQPIKNKQIVIPQLIIHDFPRYSYRGMHLDVSRHFIPIATIKTMLNEMALFKYNNFHWHLTDDQGWRIEIKKYPLLTSKGAWRNGTIKGRYPGTGNDCITHGGFYTQEEIKDLIQYAADRFITIIPEIELPGHASAAIAAYPQLSCFPAEATSHPAETAWFGPTEGKQVQQSWGVFEDVLCPTDYTFQFLNDVLDEVIQLFPSTYIHIGGDECPKESWKRSAFCQQLIQTQQLKDEHALQSYFIQRIEKYVNSKGRKIIGWDEILEGGLAPNATVMSWRGEEGGIEAAKQSHTVIMTPGTPLYFNHSQSSHEDSITQGGYNPIELVYQYEPTPAVLTSEQSKYILGAQANLWSEYIRTLSKIEYSIFPRIAALAEVLWSPKSKRNWKDFENRLHLQTKWYQQLGINYSHAWEEPITSIVALPNGKVGWKIEGPTKKKFWVKLPNEKTLTLYQQPFAFSKNGTYEIINEKGQKMVAQDFHPNLATGMPVTIVSPPSTYYPGKGGFTLVDGIINSKGLDRKEEWLGFSGTDLDVWVTLPQINTINEVVLHVLDQNESWIHLPKKITISFYTDTALPAEVIHKDIDPEKEKGNRSIHLQHYTNARFLHIQATNSGVIPEGKPGAGNKAWLFMDEIEIKN
ncbi:MAG: hypothetical protein RLY16_216, partial [Bacteroidota bacterium]